MGQRFIDANALKSKAYKGGDWEHQLVVDWSDIEEADTVEAVPVVHGRWEKEINFYFCSECEFAIHEDFISGVNYCPSCGARMDGESKMANNREILFRGFHPCEDGDATIYVEGKAVNGRWVYGDLLHWYNTDENKEFTCIIPNEYGADGSINIRDLIVLPATVCQYTGLTDKNGKRIFEGDIATDGVYEYTVIFFEGAWALKEVYSTGASYGMLYHVAGQREAIGTIWDRED